jgi:peptidoglycan/LPS O-acetylase OafA/YrhL
MQTRRVTRVGRLLLAATVAGLLVLMATTVLRPQGAYLEWADLWLYVAIGLGAAALCAGRPVHDRSRRGSLAVLRRRPVDDGGR